MNWRWWITLAMLAVMAAKAAGQSSSLYQQTTAQAMQQATTQPAGPNRQNSNNPQVRSLVAPPSLPKKIFAKNDLITVIIDEQASHSSSANTTADRDSKIDAELTAMIETQALKNCTLRGANYSNNSNPAIVGEAKRSLDSTAVNVHTDTLAARIEGRIIDIRPNGVLVIEASKKITTDEESYTISLTGNCKTEDVTPLCTILSSQIAELEIVKNSTGMVKDATKRTWFQKIFDKISPF